MCINNSSNIFKGQDLNSYELQKDLENQLSLMINSDNNGKYGLQIRLKPHINLDEPQITRFYEENAIVLFVPETKAFRLDELCEKIQDFLLSDEPLSDQNADSFHDNINGHKKP